MKISGEPLTSDRTEPSEAHTPHTHEEFDGPLPEGRVIGVIAAVKPDRGFAFAKLPGLPDCFAHVRRFHDWQDDVSKTFNYLKPGDRVSFHVVNTSHGLRAIDVEAA